MTTNIESLKNVESLIRITFPSLFTLFDCILLHLGLSLTKEHTEKDFKFAEC